METIKLLLAHSDRQVSNLIEVAVLDVCYDRAVVESSRTSRLDEFIRQGGLRDFDLIVAGAGHLFRDRNQQAWAAPEEVAQAMETIRVQRSTPIIALTASGGAVEALLEAGADSVLRCPLNAEQLKTELRALLDLNGFVEAAESTRWPGFGSAFRGFQKAKAVD
jgi:hypothetical protein